MPSSSWSSHRSSSRASVVAAAVVVAGTCVAGARPAAACSEARTHPRLGSDRLAPADGADGVPTNAIVVVGGAVTFAARDADPDADADGDGARDDALPILVVAVGEDEAAAVAGSQSLLESSEGALSIFSPDAPLAADTEHRVIVDGVVLATFTTGADVDDEPPPVPTADLVDAQAYRYAAFTCDSQPAGATFTVDAPDAVIVVAHASGDVAPVLTPPHGQVDHLGAAGEQFVASRHEYQQMRVRFASIDAAGNASGWSGFTDVELPADQCTCTTTGDARAPAAVAALAGLALAVRRRRRA